MNHLKRFFIIYLKSSFLLLLNIPNLHLFQLNRVFFYNFKNKKRYLCHSFFYLSATMQRILLLPKSSHLSKLFERL